MDFSECFSSGPQFSGRILSDAEAMRDELIRWRRTIHRCPELRMDTPVTERFLCEELAALGVDELRCGIGGHGVAAVIRGALPGGCLAIRVDCDGLPIPEQTGLPFAADNGCMHACGHDAHAAVGLGCAKLLLARRSVLRGSVKLIFQPFEEGDGGAKLMLADGVLENPHVDAVIGFHLGNLMGPQYETGDVVYTDQPDSANIYAFRATFHGKNAHVCTPHEGIDAILMACSAVMNLQEIMNRERRPDDSATLSVSMINGGTRNNVIADTCTIEGSIRGFDTDRHREYCRRAREICEASAAMFRGSADFVSTIDLMATRIDPALFRKFEAAAARLVPPEKLRRYTNVAPSGEDFARFADRVPAMHFFVCSRPADGPCYPHHHPKFDLDESVLPLSAALFTAFALSWQD